MSSKFHLYNLSDILRELSGYTYLEAGIQVEVIRNFKGRDYYR